MLLGPWLYCCSWPLGSETPPAPFWGLVTPYQAQLGRPGRFPQLGPSASSRLRGPSRRNIITGSGDEDRSTWGPLLSQPQSC